jgi:hypothetical protein
MKGVIPNLDSRVKELMICLYEQEFADWFFIQALKNKAAKIIKRELE